jgi:DNA-directed RNA polymerase subunit M/transcription elongation factor TFIIS
MSNRQQAEAPAAAAVYPAKCPECRCPTGAPYRVMVSGAHNPTNVYVRCQTCRHEWLIEVPP